MVTFHHCPPFTTHASTTLKYSLLKNSTLVGEVLSLLSMGIILPYLEFFTHNPTCQVSWTSSDLSKRCIQIFFYQCHKRNQSFSTCAKFSEKLPFLIPIRTPTRAHQELRNVNFLENLRAYEMHDPKEE